MNMLKWGSDFFNRGKVDDQIIHKFILLGIIIVTIEAFKNFCFHISGIWLSRELHSNMVFRVLHSKVCEFIERIPIGRFVNRFSGDISSVDNSFNSTYTGLYVPGLTVLADMFAIFQSGGSVIGIIPCILYMLSTVKLRNVYMRVRRDIIRCGSITKTPILDLTGACVKGATMIRVMNKEEYFQKRVDYWVEENTKNDFLDEGLGSWYSNFSAIVNFLVMLLPSYVIILWIMRRDYNPENDRSADLAFFIIRAIAFSKTFRSFIKQVNRMERNLIRAERCCAYESIEPEIGYQKFIKDEKFFSKPKKNLRLQKRIIDERKRKHIITKGTIEFENVTARYPTSVKPVLSNLNISIKPGEKIGIVGRTGAGKSTFIKLLWRAILPYSGTIKMDGIDIQKIDLKDFRDQITVITQQSCLFEGTLKDNICPSPPITINEAPRILGLLHQLGFNSKEFVENGLEMNIETSGGNLSEGEKQIVSLVRAIYCKRRIVVLDEATASVDEETDMVFQKVMKSEFAECTMVIIAHKLRSVMECDRIFVFEHGEVVESGSKDELLSNQEGVFYEMWSKM